MKALCCLAILVLLAACADTYIYPKVVDAANKLCETHGGLKWAKYWDYGNGWVRIEAKCSNGAIVISKLEMRLP